MVNKIEALLDAIAQINGADDPESSAYQLRNPLLIRSFARLGKHTTDEDGRRVFSSLISGYRAGLFDLELKLSGKSRAKLKDTDPLANVLAVYGIREAGKAMMAVSFLRRALQDEDIAEKTPLSYFLKG